MTSRVSSLDNNYTSGDLSLFPDAIDDKNVLYEARNNATSTLKFGLPYSGKIVILNDASSFPPAGIVTIGENNPEQIYYASRTSTTLSNLIRGFADTKQTSWASGTVVKGPVSAEYHNTIKDAIIKIENYLGLKTNPDSESLNGIVKALEEKYLAPKAQFRAFPRNGPSPLKVRFQNTSGGHVIRYLWDFGDGTYSIERNPTHTYTSEGYYSVQLTVYTSTQGEGISIKSNYIKVSNDEKPAFFYTVQQDSISPAYSTDTAITLGKDAAIFEFVDQTDGEVSQRVWVFGDGTTYECNDSDIHTTTHTYQSPGTYRPVLLVILTDQTVRRAYQDPLTIL